MSYFPSMYGTIQQESQYPTHHPSRPVPIEESTYSRNPDSSYEQSNVSNSRKSLISHASSASKIREKSFEVSSYNLIDVEYEPLMVNSRPKGIQRIPPPKDTHYFHNPDSYSGGKTWRVPTPRAPLNDFNFACSKTPDNIDYQRIIPWDAKKKDFVYEAVDDRIFRGLYSKRKLRAKMDYVKHHGSWDPVSSYNWCFLLLILLIAFVIIVWILFYTFKSYRMFPFYLNQWWWWVLIPLVAIMLLITYFCVVRASSHHAARNRSRYIRQVCDEINGRYLQDSGVLITPGKLAAWLEIDLDPACFEVVDYYELTEDGWVEEEEYYQESGPFVHGRRGWRERNGQIELKASPGGGIINPVYNRIKQVISPDYFVLTCLGIKGTLIFNIVWFIILMGLHVLNVVITGTPFRTHCFLTNITMLVTCLYLLLAIFYLLKGAKKDTKLYVFMRIPYIISMTVEPLVISFYWPGVAPSTFMNYGETCNSPAFCYVYTFIAHGLVIIPAWAPLLFAYFKLSVIDMVYPVVYITIYCFGVLLPYTKYIGNLYSVVTFEDAVSWVFVAAMIIGTIIWFLICYAIYRCRRKKYKKLLG